MPHKVGKILKMRIDENGYKYCPCTWCELEYQVPLQEQGWYLCEICKRKYKKWKVGEKNAKKRSN